MSAPNNLRLLCLSFSLLLSLHIARPDLPPSSSPASAPEFSSDMVPVPSPSLESSPGPSLSPGSNPSPAPTLGSGPSLSPSTGFGPNPSPSEMPLEYVSSQPSKSTEPGLSLSPAADGIAVSDGPSQFDFSVTPVPAAHVNPKVKEICESTDHPDLCLATVVPRLDRDYDVPTVLEVAIRAGSELAKIGFSLAKTVADASGVPPELASILRDCRDSYDDVVYNFESTIDAFPRRDIGTMRSMLSAVITDVGDCEDGFSGFGEESPFSNMADKLTNMTSNCLAIISLLN